MMKKADKRKNDAVVSLRNSFILSIMSVVVLLSMLVGTTYAWLQDTVTSGDNYIISGNLDIELSIWDEEEADYVSFGPASKLFSDTKWEPGHLEVAYLRLKNEGDTALDYKLDTFISSERYGINDAGETFLLSDYLMVKQLNSRNEDFPAAFENSSLTSGQKEALALLFENGKPCPPRTVITEEEINEVTTSDAMETKLTENRETVGEISKIFEDDAPLGFDKYSLKSTDTIYSLGPGNSEYVLLVVYMPEGEETAKANYAFAENEEGTETPGKAPMLTLSLSLVAKQGKDSFKDGFDDGYDSDTAFPYVIKGNTVELSLIKDGDFKGLYRCEGDAEGPLYITDESSLKAFSKCADKIEEGKVVALADDIKLTPPETAITFIVDETEEQRTARISANDEKSAETIAAEKEKQYNWTSAEEFAGIFDGNGHKITGLVSEFGFIKNMKPGAIICDTVFEKCVTFAPDGVSGYGTVAAYVTSEPDGDYLTEEAETRFEKVVVSGCTVLAKGNAGAVIGVTESDSYVAFKECKVDGCTVIADYHGAFLIGLAGETPDTMDDPENEGKLVIEQMDDALSYNTRKYMSAQELLGINDIVYHPAEGEDRTVECCIFQYQKEGRTYIDRFALGGELYPDTVCDLTEQLY